MKVFKIIERDKDHWDILMENNYRAFKIRGFKGDFTVYNDITHKEYPFNTIAAAMCYICDFLMS
jgi:hypothetical protein